MVVISVDDIVGVCDKDGGIPSLSFRINVHVLIHQRAWRELGGADCDYGGGGALTGWLRSSTSTTVSLKCLWTNYQNAVIIVIIPIIPVTDFVKYLARGGGVDKSNGSSLGIPFGSTGGAQLSPLARHIYNQVSFLMVVSVIGFGELGPCRTFLWLAWWLWSIRADCGFRSQLTILSVSK